MATLVTQQNSILESTSKEQLFTTVFLPLADAVLGYAMQLNNRRVAAAEDLVQDTYLKVWKKLDTFQEGTNAKAWMFTICRNTFINGYRKNQVRPQTTELEDGRVSDDEGFDPTGQYGVEFPADTFGYGDEVQTAIEDMSADHRQIVFLYVEGFSYEEMSDILGIKVGTVRSRLHRARHGLATTLSDYGKRLGFAETTVG